MQLDEFESTDFNYGNTIFKFQTKTLQIRHFWSPNVRNFIFVPKIALTQIWGCWFQMRQQLFQNFSPKYQNKALRFQTEEFSFLHQSFQLGEFEGADFKCENSFFCFNFQFKFTQISIICPKFKNFYFRRKLCFWNNLRVLISNITMFFFSNSSPKMPK